MCPGTHAPRWGYIDGMARRPTTTVRLDPEDAEALARAREDGLSPSDLIRKGLQPSRISLLSRSSSTLDVPFRLHRSEPR